MELKINLTTTEHKDLLSYCNLNDLLISSVVKDSFTTGFNIERYGLLNPAKTGGIDEKQVEIEVIREKRVEIPVEVIKEVVRIEYVEVEKPVEVIKEVIHQVESIQYFKEYETIKELLNQIDKIYINNSEMINIKKYYTEHYGSAINNYINPSSYVIYCIMIELLDKEDDIKDKRKYQNKYENDIKNYINPNSYIINKFMIELLDKEIDIKDKLKKETILIAKKANFLDNEILKDFYTKYENKFNKILNCM